MLGTPSDIKIGVIGGSGLYDMDELTNIDEIFIKTPFGSPSDAYILGDLQGIKIAFLPRHGRGHLLLPSEINYQANIFGFKLMGITHVISITAVGSLQEPISPLDIVIPNQLVDRTIQRKSTFFGEGMAAHISFADPFCPDLSEVLFKTASGCRAAVHRGGTLVTIEGPAFSTKAESLLYKKWGIDIIGMTTLQEAKLAREAQICYAAMAMVTDYDCWKETAAPVSVEEVIANLKKNSSCARQIIQKLVLQINNNRTCQCKDSLQNAIISQLDRIDDRTREKLNPLIGKYL